MLNIKPEIAKMFLHRLCVSFLIFPAHFFSLTAFMLDINENLYKKITIFVIRDHQAALNYYRKNWGHVLNFRGNEDLNAILQLSQSRLKQATWIVKDSAYLFTDSYTIFEKIQANKSEVSYSVVKNRFGTDTSGKIHSLTLILTEYAQIMTTPTAGYTTEREYHASWARWFCYITGYRKLSLLKKTLLIFAFTDLDPRKLGTVKQYDILHTSQVLVFVIKLSYSSSKRLTHKAFKATHEIETLRPKYIYWVCQHCQIELSHYNRIAPFTGDLEHELQINYFLQNLRSRISYRYFFQNKPPVLVAALNGDPAVGIYATRKLMEHSEKWFYLNFHKAPKTIPFPVLEEYEPYILTMYALANRVNYTLAIGGKILPNGIGRNIQAWASLVSMNDDQMTCLNQEVNSLAFWDAYNIKIIYYEKTPRFRVENFFLILANPFDYGIWIVLLITLFTMVGYIYRFGTCYQQANSRLDYAVFEVVTIVFQKHVRLPDILRISALFGFFFTEFFYLTSLTEHFIAPPEPLKMQTLSELFQASYKLQVPLITAHNVSQQEIVKILQTKRTELANQMGVALSGEKFDVKLLKNSTENIWKYWWPGNVLQGHEYKSTVSIYATSYSRRSILTYESFTLENLKMPSTRLARIKSKTLAANDNKYMHVLGKLYGHNMFLIEFCSKFAEHIEPVLKRILWENGIRLLWNRMKANRFERQLAGEDIKKNRVYSIEMWDDRFSALLKLTGTMLSLSCLCLWFECKQTRKSIARKVYTIRCHCKQYLQAVVAKILFNRSKNSTQTFFIARKRDKFG